MKPEQIAELRNVLEYVRNCTGDEILVRRDARLWALIEQAADELDDG